MAEENTSSDDKNESIERALNLELPVIAVLAEKSMPLSDVLSLQKDSVIAFKKQSDEPLEFFINDRRMGAGKAVKVSEKFGVYVNEIGTPREMIESLS